MEQYNYLEAMKEDVREAINDRYDLSDWTEDREGFEDKLSDDLFTDDGVTGNASGSYTFNSARAREYVLGNMDACLEAIREFCIEPETIAEKFLSENWEWFDVTIRCCLVGQAINEVLDELEESGAFEAPELDEMDEMDEAENGEALAA